MLLDKPMYKLPPLRFWRTLIPAAALLITIGLLSKFNYPLPDYTSILLWYSRLDPLLLLSFLRNGEIPGWLWLPLAMLLATLLAGRVFCGWLCPLGGLLALLGSVRSSPIPAWVDRLKPFRVAWLLFLLALMAWGSGWTLYLSPFHLLTEELNRIWLGQIPWLLLAIVFSGLVVFPRFWCVYLCPTGLLFSIVSRWRLLRAKPPQGCIHCGRCEKICPTGAAVSAASQTTADCLLCGRCSEKCPVDLFDFVNHRSGNPALAAGDVGFTRREVLRSGTALLVAGAAAPLLMKPTAANPLRPPGALEEAEFLSRCSRCGRCMRVCPSKCIRPMPFSSGPAMFLTPYIIAREARCELTQYCQQICPTGAIGHLPVEKTLMGLAEIDHSRCLGWSQGKLCLLCQEQCPRHAIESPDKIRPQVIADLCVGCGACENGCPIDSPAAIVVKPQPSRRRK